MTTNLSNFKRDLIIKAGQNYTGNKKAKRQFFLKHDFHDGTKLHEDKLAQRLNFALRVIFAREQKAKR